MPENLEACWRLRNRAMRVNTDCFQNTNKYLGSDRKLRMCSSNRKMFSPWIYQAALLLLFLHVMTPVSSEQILVWSQHSHKWTKLRGIYGPTRDWVHQTRKKFVTSESSRDKLYNHLGYDQNTRYLYWHEAWDHSIYRQHVNDSLVMRRNDNIELVFKGTSGQVTGLAVDWIGENVFWADWPLEMIRMTRKHQKGSDIYRTVVTNVKNPVGLGVDPIAGVLYWGTQDSQNSKIEMYSFADNKRSTLAHVDRIGALQCLSLDHSDNTLYFVDQNLMTLQNRIAKLDLADRQIQTVTQLTGALYAAIASDADYIFVLSNDNLELIVLDKLGGDVYKHVIDAIPHDIIVTEHLPVRPPVKDPECDECGDFCISLGTSPDDTSRVNARCECRDQYYFELDGRTCTSSSPRYIYSVDGELWDAVTDLPLPYTNGEATLSQIASDYKRIEAIGYHYNEDLVYFSDTTNDAIYRGIVKDKEFDEHTVNEYNVQGISVCWIADTVYWADADLRHIMLSQLDGRYHKVLLEDVGVPRGLTIDAINGYLFFVDDDQRSIKRAKTDGTDLKEIVFGLADPHAIVSDPRVGRIYWSDGPIVKSVNLDGTDLRNHLTLSQPPFGITLWQEVMTTTVFSQEPQFYRFEYNQEITMAYQPPTGHGIKSKTFAIVSYNEYLQPSLLGPCLKNGDCQQLCYPLAKGHKCGCAIGYTLDDDEKSCKTDVAEYKYVLFMDPYHKALYQLDIGKSANTIAVPITTMDRPIAFDLDRDTGKIYWIDLIKKSIRSSYTNGQEEKSVWDFQQDHKPVKLVYEPSTNLVYFLDEGKQGLYKVKDNGEGLEEIVSGINRPSALTIDIEKKLIYFADMGMMPIYSRIGVVSTDGSGERTLDKGNIQTPTGLALHEKEKILYWCDGNYGMIAFYNISSENIFKTINLDMNGQNMISLAVDDDYIYYTTRNKKSVFRVSRNGSGIVVPEALDKPIFARITDIKAYPGVRLIPPPLLPVASEVPVMWLGIGVAAAILLALLFLLLAFCVARKKKKPNENPQTHPEAALSGFDTTEVERAYLGMDNPTIYDMKHNGHANGDANGGTYMNVPNGHTTADTNGYPVVASAPNLSNGHHDNIDPNTDIANQAAVIMSTGALKPTKRYEKNKKHKPSNDPNQFEMKGGATFIQRIANRLRTGLDSIRWNGDPDGRSSRGRSSQPPNDYSNDGEQNSGDELRPKKYTKQRPALGPVKPQLHRLPQGFSPASRVTPSNVKSSVGRVKKPGPHPEGFD